MANIIYDLLLIELIYFTIIDIGIIYMGPGKKVQNNVK